MRSQRVRAWAAIVCVAFAATGCGGDEPTLAEYADEVEPAMAQMRFRILATDDAIGRPAVSPAEMEAQWRERVAAREEFLTALAGIDPPEEAAAIQAAAEDVVRRLADAEAGVAAQISEYENPSELRELDSTPAYRGFLDVDEEATNICLAAQGMFDETKQRDILADVPWIPGETEEIVKVVFGCVSDA